MKFKVTELGYILNPSILYKLLHIQKDWLQKKKNMYDFLLWNTKYIFKVNGVQYWFAILKVSKLQDFHFWVEHAF